MDLLEQRASGVEQLIRGVPGFVAYYLARTSDGGFSVSVYEHSAGTAESTPRAADWVKQNAASVAGSPPEVIDGEAFLQLNKYLQLNK